MLNRKATTNNLDLKLGNLYAVMHTGVVVNAIHSRAFLFGESNMNRFIRKDSIAPLCACGCGERVKKHRNKWNMYVVGHNNCYRKKHKVTKEIRKKLSEANKGHEVSENTKKKISIKLTGRKLSKKIKARISIASKGRKFSKKTRKKISNANKGKLKGRKASEETRKKMSNKKQGKDNPAWKGGISFEPYCGIWVDEEYKQSIKDRDNNECQNPDCRKNCLHLSLHIHHINYIKKNCHPWNLITLCVSCNARANINRSFYTKIYQEIMAQKYKYNYTQV